MTAPTKDQWITSKEILAKTGISRATLNNYIKQGILPTPVVRTPKTAFDKTKRIGYFPHAVLRRIGAVQALKREGKSIAQISEQFRGICLNGQSKEGEDLPDPTDCESLVPLFSESGIALSPELTLEGVYMPAYLLDDDFRVIWINHYAEKDIFHQELTCMEEETLLSVFQLLFDWRFHERIKNWRDLIAFHIAFVKMNYGETWFEELHEGLSRSELVLLREIYEQVTPFTQEPIRKTYFQFLTGDTISKAYGIFTLFCIEGLFFLYVPLVHI